MDEDSDDWDYIVVKNINETQNILKNKYLDKNGFITNIVFKSHGYTNGHHLSNSDSEGATTNPSNSKPLIYIKSLLTNEANIVFTACSIICDYNNSKGSNHKQQQKLVKNYSEFFLKGTNRKMLMNTVKTTSVEYINNDNSKDDKGNSTYTKGDLYWFRFDEKLSESERPTVGFMLFYYDVKGKFISEDYFYQVTAKTGGWFTNGKITYFSVGKITKK